MNPSTNAPPDPPVEPSVGRTYTTRGLCRTYGAWSLPMPCTQCFRTGLRSSAPPALRYDSQIAAYKLQVANHKSRATIRRPQIGRDKTRAPEARHNVAQPVRAGNAGCDNSEHRRCDTWRSRIVVLTHALSSLTRGSPLDCRHL